MTTVTFSQNENRYLLNFSSKQDSLIRIVLLELAMKSPVIDQSNSMMKSAEFEIKQAKLLWLNTLSLSGNINEFVVNNRTINGVSAQSFYPKYNFGLSIPLSLFARQDKHVMTEKVNFYEAQKEEKRRLVKKEVLKRYEEYLEKKDLLQLQKQMTDGQLANYQLKQKELANGDNSNVNEMNKEFQSFVEQKSRQRSREKDLNNAIIDLEEIIGVPFINVLQPILNKR